MKKFRSILPIVLLLIFSNVMDAQVPNQTNKKKLEQLSTVFQQQFLEDKTKAEAWAQSHGLQVRQELADGSILEIQQIVNGFPRYYVTDNLNAARTVSSDKVWPGGSAGLSLTGSGITLGEWDGGGVRTSHREFGGRVTQKDDPSGTSSHSTHVAGTMIASGVSANAIGMSTQGNLDAYDWDYDESEMASAGADGLLISNHSYSYVTGWYYNFMGDGLWAWLGDPDISQTEDYGFGFYFNQAQDWDEIAYNAPYYQIVKSAGNDRNDEGPSPGTAHWVYSGSSWVISTTTRDPDGGADGFDCLPGGASVAKNILTIGAVDDITGGYTQSSDVVMSSFSSWGPTDDGRIKPDIVANGVSLYSCDDDNNSDYTTMSGTSMASPNSAGSLGLLQEHYKNTHSQNPMLAATLRALLIHTADEAGANPGPDYSFGWGLLNTKSAADLISQDELNLATIQELELDQNSTYNFQVESDGAQPLAVTIAWTDPSATPPAAQLNPRTPMLVNDLDLRITSAGSGQIFYPWKLDFANPSGWAVTGDNVVDNVEQVLIENPEPGNYQIAVSHKNTLSAAQQNFSMIIEGAVQAVTACLPPYIKAGDGNGLSGDTLFIDISIEDNPAPIDAFGFKLNYSTDWLAYVRLEKGDLNSHYSFFQATENTPGVINVGGFDTTPVPANSIGTIARIVFEVVGCNEGDTSWFNITDLADDVVGLNVCDGSFSCKPQCWLGDPNMDGAITPGDALCCFWIYLNDGQVLPGECDTECALWSCDYNCDGTTTPGDAQLVFMAYLNGVEPPLECPTASALNKTINPQPKKLKLIQTAGKSEEEISFFLQVNNPGGIKSFGLDLGFPDNELEFISVLPAQLTESWQVFEASENLAGVVRIGGFNDEAIESMVQGNLAKITFRKRSEIKNGAELWLFNLLDDICEADKENYQIAAEQAEFNFGNGKNLPAVFELAQNYPNPFNMETEIEYQINNSGAVKLEIFNLTGQKIRTLINERQNSGNYVVRWNGLDDNGHFVTTGIYLYKITHGTYSNIKKLIIIN